MPALSIMIGALLLIGTMADKPMDLPCVTWEPLSSYQLTDPTNLFVAAYTWVLLSFSGQCLEKGDIFPCFATDVNTWGHHDYLGGEIDNDYCRTWYNGQVHFANEMYVPKKGPQWTTWKWVLTQSGAAVPDNAIRYGPAVMARSTQNGPGQCCGKGYTGWAIGLPNGTFGEVHFSIVQDPIITHTFEVAVCEAYHPTTLPPTPAPTTRPPVTTLPPPPPPSTPAPTTAAPTLPPNNKPYIRFGNTVPATNVVDAVIVQGETSYEWNAYKFGLFSGWVEVFKDGTGELLIYENVNGQRGALQLNVTIPLTPGPLVVVARGYWPPTDKLRSWETIAASYIPSHENSGVRLFNLSPDTAVAGMSTGGNVLVDNIKYSLGSVWASIPVESATFTIFNSMTNATLTSDTFSPPSPPFVFTNFLVGLSTAPSGSQFTPRAVPLIDAPE